MKATLKKTSTTALVALIVSLSASAVRADDTAMNISIGKMVSNLKIGGDMRLRQENFWKASPGQRDRSRQRWRLRLGLTPQIQDITLGIRLATGGGDQVSTNQSFDDLSSQKSFGLDYAYVQWKAREWLKFTGGRQPNPFWRTYASDLVFDDDYNFEAFVEQVEWKAADRLTLFANAAQNVLDEDSSDNRDQWMMSYQIGVKTKLFEESAWNFAAAYHDVDHERNSNFSQNTQLEGNTRTPVAGSTVAAFFQMAHLSTEYKTRLFAWPLSLQADYVNNIADDNGVLLSSSTQKVGYQVGVILGKASAPMSWEAAYFFKWSEMNSTLADISDSDFGDGGTNRKGHIGWIAFNPRDYVQFKIKVFVTETLMPQLPPYQDTINRAQFDVSVKF